jgi:hypothetical protein
MTGQSPVVRLARHTRLLGAAEALPDLRQTFQMRAVPSPAVQRKQG